MSVSLSATVAIPGIPRFYKSNVQGSNKSISVIPNFLKEPTLNNTDRSNLSEVEVSLLGFKREESKSILLESTFLYGVDQKLWTGSCTFAPSYYSGIGYCSILNPYRYLYPPLPPPVRDLFPPGNPSNPFGYLLKDLRISPTQILGGMDIVYDPRTRVRTRDTTLLVPISSLTTLKEPYIHPVVYHNAKGSCVTMEGWLDAYVTPLWAQFPFDACRELIYKRPFDATLSLETNKAYRYEPGKAMTFTMGIKAELTGGRGILNDIPVNSRASWGARNDTDTYRFVLEGDGSFYVERITPYAETCLRVDRKNFIDPLDGSGGSGLNIDFSKVTMYSIEFSWYGAIGANFFVYVPIRKGEAKWVKIATLLASNKYTRPSLTSPNMRLFTELYIPMGCSKLQSMSIYGSSVYMDGNFRDTLKYYTVSSTRKTIEKIPKTFITLEAPNYLDGESSRPKNNANDFPRLLNGLATTDAQIDIYEATSGGSPDILTAYYSNPNTQDISFGLASNLLNGTPAGGTTGTTTITISSSNITETSKIDFMRRMQGIYLQFKHSSFKYEYSPQATCGPGCPCGPGTPSIVGYRGTYFYGSECNRQNDWYGFSLDAQPQVIAYPFAMYWMQGSRVVSVSSSINSKFITLTLDNPIRNPMYAYTSRNTTNIALRNAIGQTGNNPVSGYPSIPLGSPIFTPGDGPFIFSDQNQNNKSFLITRKAIKSGSFSFDTDLIAEPHKFVHGAFGIISESDYKVIETNNHYLSVLNTNPATRVQIVSTSPLQEFYTRSQLHWATELGIGSGYIWGPNYYGFPAAPPFYITTPSYSYWDYTELPGYTDSSIGSNLHVPQPYGYLSGQPKQRAQTLFDPSAFTQNIDIRDHEFYFYGIESQQVAGPDSNYTYIRVKLRPQDLFSLESGIFTNNFYNFKLLVYGHNGQMYQAMSRRVISSIKNNWSASNAFLDSLSFVPGTSYNMTDASLESGGAFYYTVAFLKTAFSDINAFRSSPNLKFKFKSVFFRNIQYRSPVSTNYLERNAGLWYGTFFIPTLEPVHLFVFLGSKDRSTDYAQRLYNSTDILPRPLVTNIQQANARDKNDIILSEQPPLNTFNVNLVTQVNQKDLGTLTNLPVVNFNFEKIDGINTRADSSTNQILQLANKERKITFNVSKNIPFSYDLSGIYNQNTNVFTPQQNSLLNKDFKRFYVTARNIKNESWGSPWYFTQTNNIIISQSPSPVPLQPFVYSNPFCTDIDAARFDINTAFSYNLNVYLQNTLKAPALSDKYYIWSVFARSLSSRNLPSYPDQNASQFVIFEHKTANSNSRSQTLGNQTIYVIFDIVNDRIAFYNSGSAGFSNNWYNAYDRTLRNTFVFTGNPSVDKLNTITNAFSGGNVQTYNISVSCSFPNVTVTRRGYANLANKNNDKFVVAAHIERIGTDDPNPTGEPIYAWRRVSSCVYYKNNHTDQLFHIGSIVKTYSNVGKISLWGFQEELIPSDSTIDNLSAWYPAPYQAMPKTGNVSFNLTVGEQL